MKYITRIFIVLAILTAVGIWWYAGETSSIVSSATYINEAHRFSFTTPPGYSVQETDTLVTVENATGEGIQILMTPIDEDIPVLTAERIRADIPDLVITDTEEVDIGDSRKGLAFKSGNEAFDGASREVWFVFNGYLYQISTYERLDPILKQLFSTWQFN